MLAVRTRRRRQCGHARLSPCGLRVPGRWSFISTSSERTEPGDRPRLSRPANQRAEEAGEGVLVNLPEQRKDRARRQAEALEAVEPEGGAAVAEVEGDGAGILALVLLLRHLPAAAGTVHAERGAGRASPAAPRTRGRTCWAGPAASGNAG